VDAGYFQEEMDLWGYHKGMEYEYTRADVNSPWVHDPNLDDDWGDPLRLVDFETSAILGSLEYGLCENLDLFVRLGVADAEGTWDMGLEDRTVWDANQGGVGFSTEIFYRDKVNLDFDYGFAWQVGTAFTLCESGPWTWGGRMQFGMANPDDASVKRTVVEYSSINNVGGVGNGNWVTNETIDAELEYWQAVALLGPTYELNDQWSVYGAGGWQVLQADFDLSGTSTGTWIPATGSPSPSNSMEKFTGSGTIKHASAILVFGATWAPNESARVAGEILIGEGGKFGWGISGAIPF
jgi:opacity protein-like surface antigen